MTIDILDALAGDSERRAIAAEQNRRDFPEGTKALMAIRKVFGESARMVYIEENGRSIGRSP